MFLERHALRLILREKGRSIAVGIGVALAAALTTTVLLFGAASGATVTRRALSDVRVDAQALVAAGTDPTAAAQAILADSAVNGALPFDLVHFDAASLNKPMVISVLPTSNTRIICLALHAFGVRRRCKRQRRVRAQVHCFRSNDQLLGTRIGRIDINRTGDLVT